ncbi:hypothetical protein [Streptomyces sp. NPDC055055]
MRRLTATTLAAATLALALTGCSSQQADNRPAPAATTTEPGVFPAEQRQACVEAWAVTISDRPTDFDPETDTDPTPAACTGIPEADSLAAYMEGLAKSSKAGQDDLQKAIDDAASADTSTP